MPFWPATSDASRRTWLAALLTHRAALGLGRISYSIFLMHMFCLLLALDLFGPFAAFDRSGYTLAVVITTLVTTIGVSTLTYVYVEKPGVALGKSLAARMRPAGAVRGEA